MNASNDINQTLQGIFQMKQAGRNPQQILQLMIQQNPQIQQNLSVLQNMAQGRNPQEFFMQLAQQNGVSQQNIQNIMQMIGSK